MKSLPSSRELFRHASFWWLMIGKMNTTQWFLSPITCKNGSSSLSVIQASSPPAEVQFLDSYCGPGTRRYKTISSRTSWAWTVFTLREKLRGDSPAKEWKHLSTNLPWSLRGIVDCRRPPGYQFLLLTWEIATSDTARNDPENIESDYWCLEMRMKHLQFLWIGFHSFPLTPPVLVGGIGPPIIVI